MDVAKHRVSGRFEPGCAKSVAKDSVASQPQKSSCHLVLGLLSTRMGIAQRIMASCFHSSHTCHLRSPRPPSSTPGPSPHCLGKRGHRSSDSKPHCPSANSYLPYLPLHTFAEGKDHWREPPSRLITLHPQKPTSSPALSEEELGPAPTAPVCPQLPGPLRGSASGVPEGQCPRVRHLGPTQVWQPESLRDGAWDAEHRAPSKSLRSSWLWEPPAQSPSHIAE